MTTTSDTTSIRRATVNDIEAVISLRIEFLSDCWSQPGLSHPTLLATTRAFIERKLPNGEFRTWFAEADGEIVGTGGLLFFDRAPTFHNPLGLEAYILSIYTRPAWRGRGLAPRMMQTITDHAWEAGAGRVFLHASEAGRPVYEKLGFTAPDTEMEIFPK